MDKFDPRYILSVIYFTICIKQELEQRGISTGDLTRYIIDWVWDPPLSSLNLEQLRNRMDFPSDNNNVECC